MSALVPDLEHFRARVLQDALAEATSVYWTRRADAFDAARWRHGDFTGTATPEQILEREANLVATALACRRRAQVALLKGDIDGESANALASCEVA